MSANQQSQDDVFLREWTIPEEDRAKYTSQPWGGEYRWVPIIQRRVPRAIPAPNAER